MSGERAAALDPSGEGQGGYPLASLKTLGEGFLRFFWSPVIACRYRAVTAAFHPLPRCSGGGRPRALSDSALIVQFCPLAQGVYWYNGR